ncbi:MAG: anthranilate phosphoribosyltransferase family protein [Leptolyngbyaceae cyanobacterium bins.349]|nr:anthranilate phosphoribosyltransferase family protein [Leptolyngbyaceae cyanobacterium bins.349]
MSHAFRELLRKIGSGPHTGESLTRTEAAAATRMMLLQEATPAQIGAFMIAHRIRRPTGEELAGMLDAYEELGPVLKPIATQPIILGIPYDGRTRTAPIAPLTALMLATAGCPVILHGGDRMPTKEGDPLILFWQGLGVDWTQLSLPQVQSVFEQTGLGFLYLPHHFPLAQGLVPYREQIGKRPPFATMELMWSPYGGDAHVIPGFVHPPTEGMFQTAFALRGVTTFTTVKGLEGSCDLPRERTAILGLGPSEPLERLHLHPRDYGFEAKNVPLDSAAEVLQLMQDTLNGKPSELMQSTLWNGGFYLWRCGISPSVEAGIAEAEMLLTQGRVKQTWRSLQAATTPVTSG